MLTNILLSAILQSQKKDYDPAIALGSARAAFGENPVSDFGRPSDWLWRMRNMVGDGETIVLFPAGEHNRRYYIQPGVRYGPVEKGEEDADGWLLCMRRSGIEGSPIEYQWKEKLKATGSASTPVSFGTLELFLFKQGLRIAEPASTAARASLGAIKGFAAYMFSPGPGFATFHYWFVHADGTSSKALSAFSDLSFPAHPKTPFPYPVTDEEKAALTKQGWKFRLPWERP